MTIEDDVVAAQMQQEAEQKRNAEMLAKQLDAERMRVENANKESIAKQTHENAARAAEEHEKASAQQFQVAQQRRMEMEEKGKTLEAERAAEQTGKPIDPWISLSLLNNWQNYGGEYGGARYRKLPNNMVVLEGLIRNPNKDPHISTLPIGLRPSTRLIFPVVAGDVIGRVDIAADGKVYLAVKGAGDWVSLSGICFVVL